MLKQVIVVLAGTIALAGCVSEQKYQTEVKAEQSAVRESATYKALSEQLQSELKADQARIEQLQGQVKLSLVDQLLFPEGGWQIHRKGEETLDKIAPTLRTVKAARIVVAGHTDNVPIGPALRARFPTNWELSTARATDVLRHLASKGVPQNLLAAEGFGDSRPVASNATPEGRAQNRRVEILISGVDQ
jgi:chemotaxis protein MotB